MARIEQDREDILAEASALSTRAEFIASESSEPIVVGFRSNGAASFYFDPDFVLHFNPAGELRRAYDHGRLLKAEDGRLLALRKERDAECTVLLSRALTDSEMGAFVQAALRRLQDFHEAFRGGRVRMTRQVPPDNDIAPRLLEWFQSREPLLRIAGKPHVAG